MSASAAAPLMVPVALEWSGRWTRATCHRPSSTRNGRPKAPGFFVRPLTSSGLPSNAAAKLERSPGPQTRPRIREPEIVARESLPRSPASGSTSPSTASSGERLGKPRTLDSGGYHRWWRTQPVCRCTKTWALWDEMIRLTLGWRPSRRKRNQYSGPAVDGLTGDAWYRSANGWLAKKAIAAFFASAASTGP